MCSPIWRRGEDLDLADVRVAAVLVVGEDGDLDEVGRAHRGADRVGRALGSGGGRIVTQPLGSLSSCTWISCRSWKVVPARIEIFDGV